MIKHNHLCNNIGTYCYNHWCGVSLNNLWNQSCQFKCKHVQKVSISCPHETGLSLAVSLTSEQPLGTVASHHPPPSPSSLCTMVLPNLTNPVTAPSMHCCVPLPLQWLAWRLMTWYIPTGPFSQDLQICNARFSEMWMWNSFLQEHLIIYFY